MSCKINSITHITMINRLYTRHTYNHYSHLSAFTPTPIPVSYTHLTLPTRR